jgi:orotate phosphoribosyltransferase
VTDDKLLTMLVENGLLQFGRFEREGRVAPILLNLELLPSYPETLEYISEQAAEKTGSGFERIVCTAESLPLGIAISLKTNIPLVYSRGKGESPVYDLVGAYDVGHPAILVMNTLQSVPDVQHFISRAKQVGLHIQQVFAVTDVGKNQGGDSEISIQVLMPLSEMIGALDQQGYIPQGQANAVRDWMKM